MVVPLVVVMVVMVGLERAMARQDDGLNYAELGKLRWMLWMALEIWAILLKVTNADINYDQLVSD